MYSTSLRIPLAILSAGMLLICCLTHQAYGVAPVSFEGNSVTVINTNHVQFVQADNEETLIGKIGPVPVTASAIEFSQCCGASPAYRIDVEAASITLSWIGQPGTTLPANFDRYYFDFESPVFNQYTLASPDRSFPLAPEITILSSRRVLIQITNIMVIGTDQNAKIDFETVDYVVIDEDDFDAEDEGEAEEEDTTPTTTATTTKTTTETLETTTTTSTTTIFTSPTTSSASLGECFNSKHSATLEKCSCDVANCYKCSHDSISPGTCTGCKNGKAIKEGNCVDDCGEGYVRRGSGNFKQRCDDIETTTPPPVTTIGGGTTPTLVPGVCFNNKHSITQGACTCGIANCFRCVHNTVAAGECTGCKSGKAVQEGICVDECSEGFERKGSGNFKQRCDPIPEIPSGICKSRKHEETGEPCNCGIARCDRCLLGVENSCQTCSNGWYLWQESETRSVCIETCPDTHTPRGSGNFGRYCQLNVGTVPIPGECISFVHSVTGKGCSCGFLSNCHRCNHDNFDAGECLTCKNSKYLEAGACVDDCSQGTPKGNGSYNRKCV